jgi:type IV pilus assembly protein PilC
MQLTEKQSRHAAFWRKFLRLTRGCVPVLRTLEVIATEEPDSAFKETVFAVLGDMTKGSSMSEAMAEHPDEFSLSVVELVRAAEKSGAWDAVVKEIADGLQEGTFQ